MRGKVTRLCKIANWPLLLCILRPQCCTGPRKSIHTRLGKVNLCMGTWSTRPVHRDFETDRGLGPRGLLLAWQNRVTGHGHLGPTHGNLGMGRYLGPENLGLAHRDLGLGSFMGFRNLGPARRDMGTGLNMGPENLGLAHRDLGLGSFMELRNLGPARRDMGTGLIMGPENLRPAHKDLGTGRVMGL